MPVELRKRAAPTAPTPAPAAKRSASKPRATNKPKTVVEKVVAAVTGESSTDPAPAPAASKSTDDSSKPAVTSGAEPVAGVVEEPSSSTNTDATAASITPPAPTGPPKPATTTTTTTTDTATVPLNATSPSKSLPPSTLTQQVHLQTSTPTTLQSLLDTSTKGIIIFTYPKASTPGCTTQACLFRDAYDDLHAKGYTVYGLSGDSAKANTTFKTKQNLQYEMLCDTEGGLIRDLGMRKPGAGKGTTRGVVVIGKEGKVEGWKQAGPAATLEAVKEVLG